MAEATVSAGTGLDVQEAMDGLDGGGVVHLGPGRFEVGRSLRLPSGVTLAGAGSERTVLVLAPGADTHVVVNADLGAGNCDIGLRDLTVDGNRLEQRLPPQGVAAWAFGVWLWRVERVSIERVAFRQVRQNGLQLNDCRNVRVVDLQAHDMGWSGVGVTRAVDLDLTGVTVRRAGLDTTHSGVHVDGAFGATVEADVDGCSGNALMVDSVSGPVRGVSIAGSGRGSRCGVAVIASRDHPIDSVTVSGRFERNTRAGVFLSNATGVTVVDAVVADNGEVGVLLQGERGCRRCTIADTVLSGSGATVVETGGSTGNRISPASATPVAAPDPTPPGSGAAARARGRRPGIRTAVALAARRAGARLPGARSLRSVVRPGRRSPVSDRRPRSHQTR